MVCRRLSVTEAQIDGRIDGLTDGHEALRAELGR
jgi:hypothetical protein